MYIGMRGSERQPTRDFGGKRVANIPQVDPLCWGEPDIQDGEEKKKQNI